MVHGIIFYRAELYGSADQTMPRLTALNWQDADQMTSYIQIGGTVIDADPRIISNLISDQTASNPAALEVFNALKDAPGGDYYRRRRNVIHS